MLRLSHPKISAKRSPREDRLAHLSAVGPDSELDAKPGELYRVFLRGYGVVRDLELKVKLQELEIPTRHVAHER